MESQRSSVGVKMPVEVVSQHATKLIGINNVGTRRYQVTSRKSFVESRIITTIKLINDHFPNWVRS